LSIRKPRKAELQALLDKLAAKLPFWKARLMTREGRLVYVQDVMTASVVYHLLALDVDPWFIKAVDKLRRGFFWTGKDDARGGCCMCAWHLVCQPKSSVGWDSITSAGSMLLFARGGFGCSGPTDASRGRA
jgi:hypothetical protein